MSATVVFHESADVDARLALLELDRQVLIDAVLQALLYKARLTSHHPNLYRHSVLTNETVAALRDFLVPRGWGKQDEGNYELVVNPEVNVAIAVASGDDATGIKDRTPSNKSEKGPRTVKAVDDNRTADLFPETLPPVEEEQRALDTWILLHHHAGDAMRLELSRPNGYDSTQRFVTSWSERIVIGSIELDGEPTVLPIPQSPDVDVVVSRK
ncbi:Uncharacterised protein [Burkholderia pseudomallei]|uniref:hypothetical protein n=1 Tax=Burkholderia pseudomallei TaxID=28450 RepID=UPI000F076A29|nr:hypothetical protein [Burkholderia pseudomallei]CAJ3296697.1 Uncharacterised protein [Burkholderia pseudomallei]CAJ6243374.1 Uncharacterised protein [Burkholderia pseudomallei]VCG63126.1 Uncharacterised protein [Burkholderia pseudomallei]VCG98509.1 Uncharacterised protein [Burkholderia pseudomallei]VCH00387.1 Uncharacterised protein [Burkholderia pseudomallei]